MVYTHRLEVEMRNITQVKSYVLKPTKAEFITE